MNRVVRLHIRNFAKASKAPKDAPPQVPATFDIKPVSLAMASAIDRLKKDLSVIRTGRAHPGLLESIMVSHQDKRVPLRQIAQVVAKDSQTLMVLLSDESLASSAEKSIRDSGLGLNPQKENANSFKVPVPRMTEEFREAILKQIGQSALKAKDHIRTARANARNDLKKKARGSFTGDELKGFEKSIQNETDAKSDAVDALVEAKKKEISA